MPSKQYTGKYQNWTKITVYFKSGTKPYRMDTTKVKDFLRNLKKRTDVIKHQVENYRVYIR